MTRTFLVSLDLDPGIDLTTVADEILHDLDDFDVVSVKPWASPFDAPASSTPALSQPLATTPTV